MTALCISCERQITYRGEISAPKLVLQTEMEEGSDTLHCAVTRSAFFLDHPDTHYWVRSKGLKLTVERQNGETVRMDDSLQSDGDYMINVPLAAPLRTGEVVRISAEHPDYPDVTAADTIVPVPEYAVTSYVWDSVHQACHVRLQFGENTGYHGIIGFSGVLYHTETYKWQGKETVHVYSSRSIYSKDNLFAGMGNAFSSENGFNTFGELFCMANGVRNKEVELTFSVTTRTLGSQVDFQQDSLLLTVAAHSTVSYEYAKSLYSYFGVSGSDDSDIGSMFEGVTGVEEHVQLYSNVENGYGIVAGTSRKKTKIMLNNQ